MFSFFIVIANSMIFCFYYYNCIIFHKFTYSKLKNEIKFIYLNNFLLILTLLYIFHDL